jgi:hypothetical protein
MVVSRRYAASAPTSLMASAGTSCSLMVLAVPSFTGLVLRGPIPKSQSACTGLAHAAAHGSGAAQSNVDARAKLPLATKVRTLCVGVVNVRAAGVLTVSIPCGPVSVGKSRHISNAVLLFWPQVTKGSAADSGAARPLVAHA